MDDQEFLFRVDFALLNYNKFLFNFLKLEIFEIVMISF